MSLEVYEYPGGQILLNADESDQMALRAIGKYEPEKTQWLLHHLQEGDTFIDIGAHWGYFTLLAAKAVGPTGMVYAFEPHDYNFRMLNRNVTLNAYSWVKTNCAAIGNQHGYAKLYDRGKSGQKTLVHTPQVEYETVPTLTLDGLKFVVPKKRPLFLKIDVEGWLHPLLEGAWNLLHDVDCFLVIDLHPELSEHVSWIVPRLERLGYQIDPQDNDRELYAWR